MSRISDRRPAHPAGHTLVEVLIGTSLALIVLSGVFAAYLFLGKNLTRIGNAQEQERKGRRALRQFAADAGAAIAFTSITSASSSNLTFTVPTTLTNCSTLSGNTTIICASTADLTAGSTISGPTLTLTNCATTNGSATVTCASTTGMLVGGSISGPPLPITICATTSGSPTVTCNNTLGMVTGGAIWGTGIPSTAVVNSITNNTTFVMNANATVASANTTLDEGLIIPRNVVVSSITNGTTFVMSGNAIATTTGSTLYEGLILPSYATVSSVGTSTTFVLSGNATATTTGTTLTAAPHTITYVYTAGSSTTLTRTDVTTSATANVTTTLLTDIDPSASTGFSYYNASGATTTTLNDITQIGFSFTTKVGVQAVGTEFRSTIVSPRVVVHNKSIRQ